MSARSACGSRLAMCAASRRRRAGSSGAGEPADVQLAVLDVNSYVARGQRALEHDDARVNVERELVQTLIGGCGQPERAACGVAPRAMPRARLERRSNAPYSICCNW